MTLPRLNETRVRVFHPSATFDDVLVAFGAWMQQHGFSFGDFTAQRVAEAGNTERQESAEDEQRVREAERLHDEYLVARHARCEMFTQAIGMARLAVRRTPELLKELKGFRLRPQNRRGSKAAESGTPATPSNPPATPTTDAS